MRRKEEGVPEEAGRLEVEVVVALSVTEEFTRRVPLSTFSCICYQKSVLLSCHVFFFRKLSSKDTTQTSPFTFLCLKLSCVYEKGKI